MFVLVHGVGLSHRPYGRLARALSRHGPVIAVDLPGFGGLRRPSTAVSVPEHAQVLSELLVHMQVDSYVVVGHSMGAQIAMDLTLVDPARATALVMIGPVVDPERRTLIQQGFALARDAAKELPSTNLLILRDYIACGISWYLAETLEMMKYPTELRVGNVTVPLLVIRGQDDPIARHEWGVWLAQQSRVSSMAAVPLYRHNVVHSAPDQVAALIAAFSASIERM